MTVGNYLMTSTFISLCYGVGGRKDCHLTIVIPIFPIL